ncbi:RHS repeat-associated core domain-containing protein [Leifsonia naganoensis]|uniref:RHS repeat-associated protein n=1 Tax=Leifsonia naganoensis TaxID=150025 RepID=A0A853DU35_9MICO|nr:RHS repeat-associated protein [Leifsonia naganoensis]
MTNITYDAVGKVSQVDQLNTTTGSPGTSTTRFSFYLATETYVAGPNTSTSSSISASPHLTYTIDPTKRVSKVVDEQGRQRQATYTGYFDTASTTSGTGSTAGTTTGDYTANSGQSLTKVTSPGGAANQTAYANTAPGTQYLPSSSTDDAGNATAYTYNGTGNPLTSAQGTPTATATLTFNTDGTVATALAPGNGTNATGYGYTNHQLTSITPVTGSSLGSRAITYDDFGRVKTATDGRGNTTTYGYDKDDRLTSTTFSDGTHSVVNTYDDAGKLKTSVDAAGTTTNTYDQLERLTSTVNTAGGGTETFTYDKASHLVTLSDSRGTSTYSYDTSGVATQIAYTQPSSSPPSGVLAFATDNQGRRTDEWLQTDATNTTWSAHTHTSYDTSGRVTEIAAYYGTGNASNTKTLDISYCYSAGAVAPACPTTASADRHKIQWSKDNISGMVTAYAYDGSGRLQSATQSGATGANTYTYTYDGRGNRLTAVVTGASPSGQTLTYNAANQITTTGYSYDGAGNLTAAPGATYTYNGAQQMTSSIKSGTTSTYIYAGASQNAVLSETTTANTYQLVYGGTDQQGQPEIQQVKIGTNTAYIEHDPITGQPLLLRTSSGKQSLYVYDGTGNPAALLTSDSYVAFAYTYDPYGTPTLTKNSGGSGVPQNPYLFKGGIQDRGSGLVKFGLRWYNPMTGTWTQQDTLDAPLDPANANRYTFAGGDPTNGADPTGYSCSGAILGASASVFVEVLAGAAVIAGTPSLALGAAAAEGFAVGAGLTVSAVGDAVEECS